jgi:hypothetical protein
VGVVYFKILSRNFYDKIRNLHPVQQVLRTKKGVPNPLEHERVETPPGLPHVTTLPHYSYTSLTPNQSKEKIGGRGGYTGQSGNPKVNSDHQSRYGRH